MFLNDAGWAKAAQVPLAGDASARRYLRLTTSAGAQAILMDDPARDTDRFARMARHLHTLDLSAPKILASDPAGGLMLLEDLGDAILARLCADSPDVERTVYEAAVDVLIALHRSPAPPWATPFDSAVMAEQATLVLPWYADTHADADANAFETLLRTRLAPLDTTPAVLLLRDYHAENLIWLPDRTGVARIGLLDFQDAVAGHPAYDLASLIADARRDLAPGLGDYLTGYYAKQIGYDPDALSQEVAMLSVQRCLRILGIFARLSLRDGKAHYVDLIPRVWRQLTTALENCNDPVLKDSILAQLPPPETAHLARLTDRCRTQPTP